MDKSCRKICLFLTVFATLFETGSSIKCYECSSRKDSKCADPISGDLRPIECTRESVTYTLNEITYAVRGSYGSSDIFSGNMFSCLKVNSLNNNQYQNLTTIRGCYYGKMDERDICTMIRSKMIDQTTLPFCETCTGDACNGSNKITSANIMAILFSSLFANYFVIRQ